MTESPTKPLFKCLGGKSRLVETIIGHMPDPDSWDTYVEPFFGGGAVFWALHRRGLLHNKRAVLGDADPSVINILRAVQSTPATLHAELFNYQLQYADPGIDRSAMYYRERELWNAGNQPAARALFLRGTAFNGVWRMSRKGNMNAPWGKYDAFNVPTMDRLLAAQTALQRATLVAGDYRQAYARLNSYDRTLSYIDPPYDAGFNAYTANGFTSNDHTDLITQCTALQVGGGHVVYSNANTDLITGTIREYWPDATVHQVYGKRTVAAAASSRNDAQELLVVGEP